MPETNASTHRSSSMIPLAAGLILGGLAGLFSGGILALRGSTLHHPKTNLIIDKYGKVYPLVRNGDSVTWYVWGTGDHAGKVSRADDILFPEKNSPCEQGNGPLPKATCTIKKKISGYHAYLCAASTSDETECDPNVPIGSWGQTALVETQRDAEESSLARSFFTLLTKLPFGTTENDDLETTADGERFGLAGRITPGSLVQASITFAGQTFSVDPASTVYGGEAPSGHQRALIVDVGSSLIWNSDGTPGDKWQVVNSDQHPTLSDACDTVKPPPYTSGPGENSAGYCHVTRAIPAVHYKIICPAGGTTACPVGGSSGDITFAVVDR